METALESLIGMRTFTMTMLAGACLGVLALAGCGSSDPAAAGDNGDDSSDSGGAGGTKAGGKGGAGGKTQPAKGGNGAGGSETGTGGSEPTGDAGASDGGATGVGGGGGAPMTGGLGPGSADDSPPLVLPGSHLIFDGKTMMGWNCDAKWSVKDGAIDATGTGNSFCKTADTHDTFRLTGKSRIVKDPNNHAGICFWPIGGGFLQLTPVSGSLWDYRGGGGVRTLPRIYDYTKWNFFELLVDAKTGTVDLAVNGHVFPTFTDKKAHPKGAIALQLHAQPNEVQYKDLSLEDNPTMMKLLTTIPGK